MFGLSGFSVASWICLGCGAVVKLCSDGVISRSGAVVELFSVVGKDAGAIAPTATTASFSALLNWPSLGCGEVGSTAVGGSAGVVISVLMMSMIGSGEFWGDAVSGTMSGFCPNSAGGMVDSCGSTAGKFDRPQIMARHT